LGCSSSSVPTQATGAIQIHVVDFDKDHPIIGFTRITGPKSTTNTLTGVQRWHGEIFMREGEVWQVPELPEPNATVLGLHRIWASEVEWNSKPDMLGIWQVVQNVRAKHCNREKAPRITECKDGQETLVSSMRRLSKRVMGMMPPHNARTKWVRNVGLTCEKPEAWPVDRSWEYMIPFCEASAELAQQIVNKKRRAFLTRNAIPMAWGGRCEVPGGACDDSIACQRGLARIPAKTINAFWCRPGSRGCHPTKDPICFK